MKILFCIVLSLISHEEVKGLGTYGALFKAALNSKSFDFKALTNDINKESEKTVLNVKEYITASNIEPIKLPNATYNKKKKIFGMNFGAPKVTFTKGWLKGLTYLHRSGDVSVSYAKDPIIGGNTKKIKLIVPIAVDQMMFGYKYDSSVVKGLANGTIRHISLKVHIDIDYHTKQIVASVSSIELEKLSIKFEGKASWLAKFAKKVANGFIKDNVRKQFQISTSALVTALLGKYDKVIKENLRF